MKAKNDEETNEASQLKREIDLYLTLPKPVELSQITYELMIYWKQPLLARLATVFFSVPLTLLLAKKCSRLQAILCLFQV